MKRFYRDFRLAIIVAVIAFAACWIIGSTYTNKVTAYQKHLGLHDS